MADNPEVPKHVHAGVEFYPIIGQDPDTGKLYPIKVKAGGGLEVEVVVGGIAVELDGLEDSVQIYGDDGSNPVPIQLQIVGSSKAQKVYEASPPSFQRLQTTFAWTLSTSFVQDGGSQEVDIGEAANSTNRYSSLTLYCLYTIGTAGTGAELKVEFSPEGTAWNQESANSDSGSGPIVRSQDPIVHALADGVQARIRVPVIDGQYRLLAQETGSPSVAGTLDVIAVAGR